MNRLKELRKEKKQTQKEFAKETGTPLRTLQSWENGESQIKPDKAQQLADYFGVPVGYLLGFNDNQEMGHFIKIGELIQQKRLEESSQENAYNMIKEFLDDDKHFEQLLSRLLSYPSKVYPLASLISSDKEYKTEFSKMLINYILLEQPDQKIIFELVQSLVNKTP